MLEAAEAEVRPFEPDHLFYTSGLRSQCCYSRAKPPLTCCSSASYNPGRGLGWSRGVTMARTIHLPSLTPS